MALRAIEGEKRAGAGVVEAPGAFSLLLRAGSVSAPE
jgi:hypothetical protein